MSSMMLADDLQKRRFQERLARISSGGPNTMGQIYVGAMDDEEVLGKIKGGKRSKKKASAKVSALPSWRENILYPLSLVRGFLVGMVVGFGARYVRFHLAGGSITGADADLMMLADVGAALGATFVLRMMMKAESKAMTSARTFGVLAMVALMHNFVHMQPALFATIFSPEWTEEVQLTTQPGSILFRGVSFVIGEQAPAAPVGHGFDPALMPADGAVPEGTGQMPRILRLN